MLLLYDVSSLFTEALLEQTMNYVNDQIYDKQNFPKIGPKLLFIRHITKVTAGTIFSSMAASINMMKVWAISRPSEHLRD